MTAPRSRSIRLEPESTAMNRHQLEKFKELSRHGHGHVLPRPDGTQANCGGPRVCRECLLEKLVYETTDRVVVVEAMNIKPGDQILLLAPPTMPPHFVEEITAKFKRDFPDVGVTVMQGFMGVQVHRQDPSV